VTLLEISGKLRAAERRKIKVSLIGGSLILLLLLLQSLF
jgi:hypothetical protein